MVSLILSGVIIVVYVDLVNPNFCIALMVFVKVLPMYLCDVL